MHAALPAIACVVAVGCVKPEREPIAPADSHTVTFRVVTAQEHLGHSTAAGTYIHEDWYDGCRGNIMTTGEDIVIWWWNNEIKDTPFHFESGKTYTARFKGEFQDAIMGYKGKCLRVLNLVKLEETLK